MWLTLKPPLEKPRQPRVRVVATRPWKVPEANGISIRAPAEVMKPAAGT